MTETKAIVLIVAAATMLEATLILGLAAVGVGGPVLGLGAIVPLALAAFACSSAVGRDGGGNRLRR